MSREENKKKYHKSHCENIKAIHPNSRVAHPKAVGNGLERQLVAPGARLAHRSQVGVKGGVAVEKETKLLPVCYNAAGGLGAETVDYASVKSLTPPPTHTKNTRIQDDKELTNLPSGLPHAPGRSRGGLRFDRIDARRNGTAKARAAVDRVGC